MQIFLICSSIWNCTNFVIVFDYDHLSIMLLICVVHTNIHIKWQQKRVGISHTVSILVRLKSSNSFGQTNKQTKHIYISIGLSYGSCCHAIDLLLFGRRKSTMFFRLLLVVVAIFVAAVANHLKEAKQKKIVMANHINTAVSNYLFKSHSWNTFESINIHVYL